jgi:nucleoid-associated protein YgaU
MDRAPCSAGRVLLSVLVPLAGVVSGSVLLAPTVADGIDRAQQGGPAGLDGLLAAGAAALAWVVLSWLAGSTLVAVRLTVRQRPGTGRLRRLVPGAARRSAALLLGVGLAATVVGPAAAATVPPTTPQTVAANRHRDLPSGWTPDRPVGADVVVRAGDSLWSIAAARLGPSPPAGAVARAWPRWYAANADRIGPDPGLIHPGLLLRDPGTASPSGAIHLGRTKETR